MRITPLEIRQKSFERQLRGYDKDEVTAFLMTLSQEWERLQDEVKEYKIKLESSEREVGKLREVESSLYKTLKTAEDTGASVIDQAKKAADLHLKESQLKAEAMMNEAKVKAKAAIEDAESTSRQMLEEMEDRLKELAEQYKTIESHHANLLGDLKRIASETIDRVERIRKENAFNPDQHVARAKKEMKKALFPNADPEPAPAKPEPVPSPAVEPVVAPAKAEAPRKQGSFFDTIE
ncbi:MAG: DivIVA domain-containing protein [Cyclobacteriaceae bacterium]|nr:DivIVA domain-containing protein [Cyclobacteriaceae bacterium]